MLKTAIRQKLLCCVSNINVVLNPFTIGASPLHTIESSDIRQSKLLKGATLGRLSRERVKNEMYSSIIQQKLKISELPKPTLGDITDMKAVSIKVQKAKNPAVLGLSYAELVAIDTITVELVPQKKGIILKHNEYSIYSQVRWSNIFIRNSGLGQ